MALHCDAALFQTEAADCQHISYCMCPAAFRCPQGFKELKEKLFVQYEAAVDNKFYIKKYIKTQFFMRI